MYFNTKETLLFALPNRPLLNALIGGLSRLIGAGGGGCVTLFLTTSRVIHPGGEDNQPEPLIGSVNQKMTCHCPI